MATPNCVMRNARRAMILVDMYATPDRKLANDYADQKRAEGLIVRFTRSKAGARQNPYWIYKVSSYRKK